MPSLVMAKVASPSGKHGESYILQIRDSALPFLIDRRVYEACAIICPPIGFLASAANMAPPSTCATT